MCVSEKSSTSQRFCAIGIGRAVSLGLIKRVIVRPENTLHHYTFAADNLSTYDKKPNS